jgi:hypothetical protein
VSNAEGSMRRVVHMAVATAVTNVYASYFPKWDNQADKIWRNRNDGFPSLRFSGVIEG